jgi:radical SAM superfamily enzyme YgiQ (UPF0313 family)
MERHHRANMVTPELLDAMKAAGCVAVNFGVESGDDEILRVIKKAYRLRMWCARWSGRRIAG